MRFSQKRSYTSVFAEAITKSPYATKESAIYGPVFKKLFEIQMNMRQGKGNYPFDKVYPWQVGNPHNLGQPPMTKPREIFGAMLNHRVPDTKADPAIRAEAQELLKEMGGELGAYHFGPGYAVVREALAEYIGKRDGIPCDPNSVVATCGAGTSSYMLLEVFGKQSYQQAVMLPSPAYPNYYGNAKTNGWEISQYKLDREDNLKITMEALEEGFNVSPAKPTLLFVTNPGNPTGALFDVESLKNIIRFCYEKKIAIVADEVYQDMVLNPEINQFHSIRKLMMEMGEPYASGVPVFSLNSVSKNYLSEGGTRSGFIQFENCPAEWIEKINFWNNLHNFFTSHGQLYSYFLAKSDFSPVEMADLRQNYQEKVNAAVRKLESIKQVRIMNKNFTNIYLFFQINIPLKASDVAKAKGFYADDLFCFELLEQTGITLQPGSSFFKSEKETLPKDQIFVRISIPYNGSTKDFEAVLDRIDVFLQDFWRRYE